MAAKIGILGESTSVSIGTITVYTVPSDKAARIRVLFAAEHSSNFNYAVLIGTPGSETNIVRDAGSSGQDVFTGIIVATTQSAKDVAIIEADMGGSLTAANVDRASILPFPADFFLSDGDTVRVAIGGNDAGDHLVQVIGVEDDA